jgi:hypothetical protein
LKGFVIQIKSLGPGFVFELLADSGIATKQVHKALMIKRALLWQKAFSRFETPTTTNGAHVRDYKAPVHEPGILE